MASIEIHFHVLLLFFFFFIHLNHFCGFFRDILCVLFTVEEEKKICGKRTKIMKKKLCKKVQMKSRSTHRYMSAKYIKTRLLKLCCLYVKLDVKKHFSYLHVNEQSLSNEFFCAFWILCALVAAFSSLSNLKKISF